MRKLQLSQKSSTCYSFKDSKMLFGKVLDQNLFVQYEEYIHPRVARLLAKYTMHAFSLNALGEGPNVFEKGNK